MNEDEINYEEKRTRRKSSSSSSNSLLAENFGKLPPQAIQLEEAVLGAILLEKSAFEETVSILHDECFYKDAHKIIFRTAQKLYSAHQPIDIATICNALKEAGELDIIGGPFYITQLTNRVASSANIEFHARIIFQQYIKR